MMNIYVSNLGFHVEDEELKKLFEPFGAVSAAKVIKDRTTGYSRGFGFVEMNSDEAGNNAMIALQNTLVEGRALSIKLAKERELRQPRTGY